MRRRPEMTEKEKEELDAALAELRKQHDLFESRVRNLPGLRAEHVRPLLQRYNPAAHLLFTGLQDRAIKPEDLPEYNRLTTNIADTVNAGFMNRFGGRYRQSYMIPNSLRDLDMPFRSHKFWEGMTPGLFKAVLPHMESCEKEGACPHFVAQYLFNGIRSGVLKPQDIDRAGSVFTSLSKELQKIELPPTQKHPEPSTDYDSVYNVLAKGARRGVYGPQMLETLRPALLAMAREGYKPDIFLEDLIPLVREKVLKPHELHYLAPIFEATVKAGHDPLALKGDLVAPSALHEIGILRSQPKRAYPSARFREVMAPLMLSMAKQGQNPGLLLDVFKALGGTRMFSVKTLAMVMPHVMRMAEKGHAKQVLPVLGILLLQLQHKTIKKRHVAPLVAHAMKHVDAEPQALVDVASEAVGAGMRLKDVLAYQDAFIEHDQFPSPGMIARYHKEFGRGRPLLKRWRQYKKRRREKRAERKKGTRR